MNLLEFNTPSKIAIAFDEEAHRYTDEFNTKYTSVTTVIKDYEIPFDREYWLAWKAEKLQVSVEELDAVWVGINKDSLVRGNEKHNYLEGSIHALYANLKNTIKGFFYRGSKTLNREQLEQSDLQFKHNKIYRFLVQLLNQGYTLYPEYRVYNQQVGICGTIDVLAVKSKDFIIVDWKTNKDLLSFRAGYFKKDRNGIKTNKFVGKEEYFKYPLGDIEFCKGEIYTLQLSMYAFLTELFGLNCVGLYLWHIRDSDVMYEIKYRKQHIHKMITHHYKKKQTL